MAEYYLEANIDDQQTHLMNLLFADDHHHSHHSHHHPAMVQPAQFGPQYPDHHHPGLVQSFRHDVRPDGGSSCPSTHVHPMYYAPGEAPAAASPDCGGFANNSSPPMPIVARHYISTAAGGHFVEQTLLPQLPDRVARNVSHHRQPLYNHYRGGGGGGGGAQSQFGGGSGIRSAEATRAMEQLELEPIPPKPLLLRERIHDKLADVCKVLSTLSAQKCHRPPAASGLTPAMRAHHYAPPEEAGGGGGLRLPQCWAYLSEALTGEYRQVLAVTLALERECHGHGGMPADLQPTRAIGELAEALDKWQLAKTAALFATDDGGGATAPIAETMENEVNALLELLDQLFLAIRMACTNMWLMRTVLLCARDRPAAPQTPPHVQPPPAPARLMRLRRAGA